MHFRWLRCRPATLDRKMVAADGITGLNLPLTWTLNVGSGVEYGTRRRQRARQLDPARIRHRAGFSHRLFLVCGTRKKRPVRSALQGPGPWGLIWPGIRI